jgi:hypothetical protein
MDKAELPIELVSLFFQVFAGCLQGENIRRQADLLDANQYQGTS